MLVLMVALEVPRVVALEVAMEVAVEVAKVALEVAARLTVVVIEDKPRRLHNEMLMPVVLLEDHHLDKILRLLLPRLLLLRLLVLLRLLLVSAAGVQTAQPLQQTQHQAAEDRDDAEQALR